MAREVNCAEAFGNLLLLGIDDGLYCFETDGKCTAKIETKSFDTYRPNTSDGSRILEEVRAARIHRRA